jgi:5-methylcytosine-specific restriction endonuclease McrBC GTP-binding regulatory subunit McrB
LNSKVEKYYFGIEGTLFDICEYLIENQNQSTQQNFVIIIDEINRANISRVFGELITLIEPDKRSHGTIPLETKLPSGDSFTVPSNLFIIGTMNTADKSIALLDIALRRRFEFEAMYPKYEIKGQVVYDVEILKKINKQIINSKGYDFQIGHSFFMGENKDLVQRMNKKVIPLLLEYYMNDEKEVKGILNSAGLIIEENSWPIKILGKND